MHKYFQPTQIAHSFIEENVMKDGIYIDATCGRGNDTVFLSKFLSEKGEVIALDIQEEAIKSTKEILSQNNITKNINIYLDSHIHIQKYAKLGTVDCIMFNLGWLPQSDHSITTNTESTLCAIENSLALLKPNGIISIMIYYGKDLGSHEKDRVLEYISTINHDFTVLKTEFLNRGNNPPINVFIVRDC